MDTVVALAAWLPIAAIMLALCLGPDHEAEARQ